MRLLVVSSWLPFPLDNGSRLRAYHLLKHLARRHEITLLTFGHPRGPADVAALRAFCSRVDVVPAQLIGGGRLGLRGLLSPVPRYFVQTESPRMTALVDAAVGSHDAAVGLQPMAAQHLTRRTGDIPTVLEELEVGVFRERPALEPHILGRLRHGLTWWKFRRFARTLVDRFDRTTVVSEREREHLQALGCDMTRVAVIPNGVEVPELPPVGVRVPRLIYPGSVAYSANLDAVRYFIKDVFPLVRRSRPELDLWVTGATDGVDISDLAGRPGVTFTGRLPDVSSLIAESVACVVPLRIGGGTRLKVLHAMAVRTPVVSSSKGIEGLDVVADRHVLVGDSPETLAAQTLRVVTEPELGERLASAAERLVRERYGWEPSARLLELVIESAVQGRAPRRNHPAP